MHHKKIVSLGIMLSICSTSIPTAFNTVDAITTAELPSTTFTFSENLKVTDKKYPDINYLQFILNRNSATQVASQGPGSDTELTDYFGQKTLDAVKRFQELYRSEVLTPAGITVPSGFVGAYTRQKLNQLMDTKPWINGQGVVPNPPTLNTGAQNLYTAPIYNSYNSQPVNVGVFTPIAFQATGIENTNNLNSVAQSPFISTTTRPIVTGVNPRIITSPDQTITIFGKDFAPNPTIQGNLGIAKASSTATTTSGTANQFVTVRLKDFSVFEDMSYYYSSSTQDISLQIVNPDAGSAEVAIVTYTFPRIGSIGRSVEPDNTKTSSALANGITALGVAVGAGLVASALSSALDLGGASAVTSALSPIKPFGGKILAVTPCLDSANFLLYILDARGTPMRLIFIPGVTKLHQMYSPRPGANALGTYMPGGWCSGAGGLVRGFITKIGTSL